MWSKWNQKALESEKVIKIVEWAVLFRGKSVFLEKVNILVSRNSKNPEHYQREQRSLRPGEADKIKGSQKMFTFLR